jgi:hypothetical protein
MNDVDLTNEGDQFRPDLCVEPSRIDEQKGVKVTELAIFVSKRVQRVVAAVLCLMALQMLISLSSCHPEFTPAASVAQVQAGG